MTPIAAKALGHIRDYVRAHGYSPTYREIAKMLGYNTPSSALRVVDILVASGHIKRAPRTGTGRGYGRNLTLVFGPDNEPNWQGVAEALIAECKQMRETLKQHDLPRPKKAVEY
jgi:hypothetical protein